MILNLKDACKAYIFPIWKRLVSQLGVKFACSSFDPHLVFGSTSDLPTFCCFLEEMALKLALELALVNWALADMALYSLFFACISSGPSSPSWEYQIGGEW